MEGTIRRSRYVMTLGAARVEHKRHRVSKLTTVVRDGQESVRRNAVFPQSRGCVRHSPEMILTSASNSADRTYVAASRNVIVQGRGPTVMHYEHAYHSPFVMASHVS